CTTGICGFGVPGFVTGGATTFGSGCGPLGTVTGGAGRVTSGTSSSTLGVVCGGAGRGCGRGAGRGDTGRGRGAGLIATGRGSGRGGRPRLPPRRLRPNDSTTCCTAP